MMGLVSATRRAEQSGQSFLISEADYTKYAKMYKGFYALINMHSSSSITVKQDTFNDRWYLIPAILW